MALYIAMTSHLLPAGLSLCCDELAVCLALSQALTMTVTSPSQQFLWGQLPHSCTLCIIPIPSQAFHDEDRFHSPRTFQLPSQAESITMLLPGAV